MLNADGGLNMILAAHREMLADQPELARVVLTSQKQGSTHAMPRRPAPLVAANRRCCA
ncbi:MAG TPA: hypothetical protein VND19_17610 [Acetobacteraceae bacterium]|nr:hypothetical protein [Acetobacteraceae bacterium]